MAKKQKQNSQNPGAPQDETPPAPPEKRKKNTTPVQKKEKPRPARSNLKDPGGDDTRLH